MICSFIETDPGEPKIWLFGAQVKDTGKGASREEAQQQAAKKVKSSFHLNGSYSAKTKTKAKAKTKTKTKYNFKFQISNIY